MRKHRFLKKLTAFLLAVSCTLGVCCLPAAATTTAATKFADVATDSWYYEPISNMTTYLPGIISGYSDGLFHPADPVTRGAFCSMVWNSMGEGMDTMTVTVTGYHHWAYKYWLLLYENDLLLVDYNAKNEKGTGTSADMTNTDITVFDGSSASLNTPITRYEMAVIIANATRTGMNRENRATVTKPSEHITDYSAIPSKYTDAVEQVYAKGIVAGDGQGNFNGDHTLNRASAAWVIYRLLWSSKRYSVSWATTEKNEIATIPVTTSYTSFATRYKSMSDAERRLALFGSSTKTHFTSANDAAGHIVTITIPAWYRTSSGGDTTKYWKLQVNTVVADEVQLIFNEIYQAGTTDPSQRFYIKSIGGARYSDALRHSWGCAIDINWEENYYCRITNGVAHGITGSGYWPGSNIYSIQPNGIAVRTFAKYGWGWGGQGWSGGYHDYMHFSILSSGG